MATGPILPGMQRRPNVLLITTDEQRFDALGCNGNRHIRTPSLDRLASRSINLLRHYTSNPLCTPARASLLTGQFARSHGAYTVGTALPPTTPGLGQWLAAAGYRTGLFGKAHLEPELTNYPERMDPAQAYYGFERCAITEDTLVGPYLERIRRQHPQHLANVLRLANEGLAHTYGKTNGRLDAAFVSPVPEPLHQTPWITDRTLEFIEEAGGQGKPFFAWCSYVDPHHPWTPPQPFADWYDPATLPPPRRRPGENEGIGDGYCHLDGLADGEYQRLCAYYYAMVSHIDHHVGRLLGHLEQHGQFDNTIILFTTDHGEYNGDHGLIRKCRDLYDSLLHIPMLLHLPDGRGAGQTYSGLSEHEDLAPTILELLDLPIPETVQGVSLARALRGETEPPRHYVYHEFKQSTRHDGIVAIRRDDWKLTLYGGGRGFVLTNLRDDPMEYDNRAGQAADRDIEAELKDALLRWLIDTPRHGLPRTAGW